LADTKGLFADCCCLAAVDCTRHRATVVREDALQAWAKVLKQR
jgi:hypothetical protein